MSRPLINVTASFLFDGKEYAAKAVLQPGAGSDNAECLLMLLRATLMRIALLEGGQVDDTGPVREVRK